MRRLITDTLVIAERNLVRLPRNPELLVAFTIQPIMFVLLFRYVPGGSIKTPGFSYADYLVPGIIVQNIAFGGFVTALGINEDLHKGLIDRFRSLPMARPAVLAGRTFADIVTNALSAAILVATGLIIGFHFHTGVLHVLAGVAAAARLRLRVLVGLRFLGMLVSTAEAANSVGFIVVFPRRLHLLGVRRAQVHADRAPRLRQRQPVHGRRRRDALALARSARRQQRMGRVRVGRRDHRGLRAARGGALPPGGQSVNARAAIRPERGPTRAIVERLARMPHPGVARC